MSGVSRDVCLPLKGVRGTNFRESVNMQCVTEQVVIKNCGIKVPHGIFDAFNYTTLLFLKQSLF